MVSNLRLYCNRTQTEVLLTAPTHRFQQPERDLKPAASDIAICFHFLYFIEAQLETLSSETLTESNLSKWLQQHRVYSSLICHLSYVTKSSGTYLALD
jgi:hypothetical protein